LKVYRCPSDETTSGDPFYGPGNYATNNLICAKRAKFSRDFPNGMARTILFAEKYAACSYWALAEGREVPWYVANESSGFQIRPLECDPSLPQSPHRGYIQVGMVDGSVRSVASSISHAEWYGMNGPAGGNHLDDEQ
jgi:prepilin-type processing-associated H-X9-DG protein